MVSSPAVSVLLVLSFALLLYASVLPKSQTVHTKETTRILEKEPKDRIVRGLSSPLLGNPAYKAYANIQQDGIWLQGTCVLANGPLKSAFPQTLCFTHNDEGALQCKKVCLERSSAFQLACGETGSDVWIQGYKQPVVYCCSDCIGGETCNYEDWMGPCY